MPNMLPLMTPHVVPKMIEYMKAHSFDAVAATV